MKPSIDSLHLPHIDSTLRLQATQYVRSVRATRVEAGPIITISREFGCEGYALSGELARRLSSDAQPWMVYSRDMHDPLSPELDPVHELNDVLDASGRDAITEMFDKFMADKPTDMERYASLVTNMRILTRHGFAVILGGGGAILTKGYPKAFHVRLQASEEFRVNRIAEITGLRLEEAQAQVAEHEKNRVAFIQKYTKHNVAESHLYDMILNNGTMSVHQMSELILLAMNQRGLL
jgi:cytidylate kinase